MFVVTTSPGVVTLALGPLSLLLALCGAPPRGGVMSFVRLQPATYGDRICIKKDQSNKIQQLNYKKTNTYEKIQAITKKRKKENK